MAENNQADLTVIDVIPLVTARISIPAGGPITTELQTAMIAEKRKVLESLVGPFKQRLDIRIEVMVGTTFLEVIRTVLRNSHDLVIKPAENPKYLERIFGSCHMHLLRKCPRPVWLMQSAEKSNYACILAAVDFGEDASSAAGLDLNQQIIELSSSLALSDFATLHIVHAWDAPGEMTVRTWSDNPDEAGMSYVEGERLRHESALNRLREQLRNQVGTEAYDYLAPQFHLRRGPASTVIPETAKQLRADLIVMGTVARTGIAGLFIGNTAEAILEQLECSVLSIKPHGFVSPVKLSQ